MSPSGARRWGFLAAFAGSVVLVDQLTKLWAMRVLQPRPGGRLVLIDGLLDFLYAENTGAAWSLMGGAAEWFRRPFLVIVSAVASGLMLWMYAKTAPGLRLRATALAMLLAGAIGNMIDRALRGYVVDFVRAHWFDQASWPIFNVADIAISAGIGALLLDLALSARRERARFASSALDS